MALVLLERCGRCESYVLSLVKLGVFFLAIVGLGSAGEQTHCAVAVTKHGIEESLAPLAK